MRFDGCTVLAVAEIDPSMVEKFHCHFVILDIVSVQMRLSVMSSIIHLFIRSTVKTVHVLLANFCIGVNVDIGNRSRR